MVHPHGEADPIDDTPKEDQVEIVHWVCQGVQEEPDDGCCTANM